MTKAERDGTGLAGRVKSMKKKFGHPDSRRERNDFFEKNSKALEKFAADVRKAGSAL